MAFHSCFFMEPKSTFKKVMKRIMARVNRAYRLYGMVCKKTANPLMPASSGTEEVTAAAQEEIGAIMQTGAAVASIK